MGFLEGLVKLADRVTDSWSTRVAANHFLAKYGTLTHLKIDRQTHSIEAEMQLHGESTPISLKIDAYEFHRPPHPGDAAQLVLHGVWSSRDWLKQLAADFLENKPLPVPPEQAKYLAMIL